MLIKETGDLIQMKQCSTEGFREKEVINVSDGKRLGYVTELEFDICEGKITAIVIPIGHSFFCFGGKEKIVIPWCKIERIGEDVILVNADGCLISAGRKGKEREKQRQM